MRKYLTELIGTFFLVLTIGATITTNAALAPLAIGGALMVMVYAGGHVSGAHYNPAVTVAVLIRRRIAPIAAAGYVAAQLAGAALAALAVNWMIDGSPAQLSLSGRAIGTALLAEALLDRKSVG